MTAPRFDPAADAWPQARDHLLHVEGGYADIPADRGGETYAGISRVFHPDWPGWEFLDSRKGDVDFPACLAREDRLAAMVTGFYFDKFWISQHLDALPRRLACAVFDCSVNSGGSGIRMVQRALNDISGESRLRQDGVLGPRSREELNRWCEAECDGESQLIEALLDERQEFYESLSARDPRQRQFLRGWTNRNRRLAAFLGVDWVASEEV